MHRHSIVQVQPVEAWPSALLWKVRMRNSSKTLKQLRVCATGGLTKLKSLSIGLSVGLQEIVKGIVKEEESFTSHAEKIFAIRRGNDYRLDLKHLREELTPLVAAVQKNIDQIGVNMSGLLEGETQRTLGLQRSMWLIALISVSVSVPVGAFVTVLLPLKITTLFRNMVTELIYGASNVASASGTDIGIKPESLRGGFRTGCIDRRNLRNDGRNHFHDKTKCR